MVSLPHRHASASTIPPGESATTLEPGGGGLLRKLDTTVPVPAGLVLDPWTSDRAVVCWARCALYVDGRSHDDPTTNPDWAGAVAQLVEHGWLTVTPDGYALRGLA